MASKHQGVQHMLSTLLSFFARKTDFFHLMTEKDMRMGFPLGRAEAMLLQEFRVQQRGYVSKAQPAELQALAEFWKKNQMELPPLPSEMLGQQTMPPRMVKSQEVKPAGEGRGGGGGGGKVDEHISPYNGGVTESYRWSQTIEEVSVEVPLEGVVEGKVKAKELKVEMTKEELKVWYRGEKLFKGSWFLPIRPDDSVWSVEDGKRLLISAEKGLKEAKTWWKSAFKGHKEIDVTKVDSTRKIDEYDEETQGCIRKILFDESQKAKGEPTSDQIRTCRVMEDAWNAEGSPFKGQPFDPSLLNLTGSGATEEALKKMEEVKLQKAVQEKEERMEKERVEGGA